MYYNNHFKTAHNWQKLKSRFLTCPCYEIHREEAFGLKSSNYTFKNHDFCEYVKFGAISLKFNILSITAWLKFESKILLNICDTYNCDYLLHTTFRFYLISFQLIHISLLNSFYFCHEITLHYSQISFSRKCF